MKYLENLVKDVDIAIEVHFYHTHMSLLESRGDIT